MGMYLYKEKACGGRESVKVLEASDYGAVGKPAGVDPQTYVKRMVGHWLSALAIDEFFMSRSEGGVGYTDVAYGQLKALCVICEGLLGVLEVDEDGGIMNPELAEKLLPQPTGVYDGDYIHQLEQTVEQLRPIVNDPKSNDPDVWFRYERG